MGAESLLREYAAIDKCCLNFRNLTNCFQSSREYLINRVPYSLNAAKIISDPRSFSRGKDIYHVEIFDKNTCGHSFLLVRRGDSYKLLQSFQDNYKLREEKKIYSAEDAYALLKQISDTKTLSKEAIELIRRISKVNNFSFNSCYYCGDECGECGYTYKKTRLRVVINEYTVKNQEINQV